MSLTVCRKRILRHVDKLIDSRVYRSQLFLRLLVLLFDVISAAPAIFVIATVIRTGIQKKRIRIGCFTRFHQEAIGHLVVDSSILLARDQMSRKDSMNLFFFEPSISACNHFWKILIYRNLITCPWFLLHPIYFWLKVLNPLSRSLIEMPVDESGSRDINCEIFSSSVKWNILDEENKVGYKFLENIGWSPEQPYACLLVRDNAYKGNEGVQSTFRIRNSKLSDFSKLLEWFALKRINIIRMGRKSESSLEFNSENVYDYSFSPFRSDFLDVWLFANCKICISTAAGIDSISNVFKRPIVYINHVIPELATTWGNALHSFKIFRWGKSGRELSLREMLEYSWWSSGISLDIHKSNDIVCESLSPHIIASIAKEGWLRANNEWTTTQDERRLSERAFSILEGNSYYRENNNKRNSLCLFSYEWLQSKDEEFFD